MASTNQTANYGLPVYQGTDKAEWTDTNSGFSAIDTAIKTAVDNSTSAGEALSALAERVTTAEGTIVEQSADIGALEINVASAKTASGTTFSPVGAITAADVQNAVAQSTDSSKNSYDNTTSGLSSTNVQGAIDDLATKTHVKATADGSKTFAELLYSFKSVLDGLSRNQIIGAVITGSGGEAYGINTGSLSGSYMFNHQTCGGTQLVNGGLLVGNSVANSHFYRWTCNASGNAASDLSSTVATYDLDLYY